MQIFATSNSAVESAQSLDDKRVIKMILESAQLLSNSFYYHGWENPPLKRAMFNHPCSIFAREDYNFIWLVNHFERLNVEYYLRFNKWHSYDSLFLVFFRILNKYKNLDFDIKKINFVNCTPHKDIKDTHLAYKITLCEKWANDKRKPKWTNSTEPKWRKEICLQYNIPYI